MPIHRRYIPALLALLISISVRAQLPRSFRGTQPNVIENAQCLDTLFRKIQSGANVRILQIGDSHVRGNYFPRAVEHTLVGGLGGAVQLDGVDPDTSPQPDGGIAFSYIGINGARAVRFTEPDMLRQIEAAHADLVIVSFGTNEAHGQFDTVTHDLALDALIDGIRKGNPEVAILLTTPPGSYIATRGSRWRDRRRRWHYNTVHTVNPRTEQVAGNIVNYARRHQLAVWNLYDIAGGSAYACPNWRNAGLMNTDQIHYTADGYTLQGTLLADAILQAYNQYVQH